MQVTPPDAPITWHCDVTVAAPPVAVSVAVQVVGNAPGEWPDWPETYPPFALNTAEPLVESVHDQLTVNVVPAGTGPTT